MSISDYKKADCELFRTPPMNISEVEGVLERALVDAWRVGGSAQNTVYNLVNNSQVVDTLASQVSEALEFQRENALAQMKKEQDQIAAKKEEEITQKAAEIEQTYSAKIEETKQTAAAATQELTQINDHYSAAQANLDAVRQRVEEKLAEIGGTQGLEQLLQINDALTKPLSTKETPRKEYSEKPREKETKAYESPRSNTPNETYVPQHAEEEKQDELYEPSPVERPQKKTGKISRAASTIWRILNYKIW